MEYIALSMAGEYLPLPCGGYVGTFDQAKAAADERYGAYVILNPRGNVTNSHIIKELQDD